MKLVIKISLVIFCLLNIEFSADAQNRKVLSIGDRVPDLALGKPLNYSNETMRTSDFNGMAIIIDFWAPWCSPCMARLPKLDSLQKKFQNKLKILLATKESREFSQRALTNLREIKHTGLFTSVVDDTILSRLFPYRIIPHYIWIGPDGLVKAITGSEEVTTDNISQLTEGKELNLQVKKDVQRLDYDRPLFATGQIDAREEVLQYSILTKYIQNVSARTSRGKNWITCTGHTISMLYKVAVGQFSLAFLSDSRVILEGFDKNDSLMIGERSESSKKEWKNIRYENIYNYELVLPDSNYSVQQLCAIMVQDLNKAFENKGINVKREIRPVISFVLTRTSLIDKIKTKGNQPKEEHSDYYINIKNLPISRFVTELNIFFPKIGVGPILEETEYKSNIDIEINCDPTDIAALNKELGKYDLKLIQKETPIEVIVFKMQKSDIKNKKAE